jgi:hypothetical protein
MTFTSPPQCPFVDTSAEDRCQSWQIAGSLVTDEGAKKAHHQEIYKCAHAEISTFSTD